jgi:tetratricopeptide (TPR) repeat protein
MESLENAMGSPGGAEASRLQRLKQLLATDSDNTRLARDCIDLAMRVGDFDFVLGRAQRTLATTPDDRQALFDRASALIGKHNYREAAQTLRALLEHAPEITAAWINLGICCYAEGGFAEARSALDTAYAAGERSPDVLRLLVSSYHHLGLVDEAVVIADANPAPPECGAGLPGVYALLYMDADRPEEAARYASQALAANPDSVDGLITRGTLQVAQMQVEPAQRSFARVLELAPNTGRAWIGLGTLALLEQDFVKAKEQLSRGLETMPRHVGSWLVLAWTHIFLQELEDAERVLNRAMELDRNFAETHGALASVLALRGDREGAEREIEIAQRLDPEGLSAQHARSVITAQAGDPKAARRMIQLAVRGLSPGDGSPIARILEKVSRH